MRLLFLPTIHLVLIDATEPELATHAMYHYDPLSQRPTYMIYIFKQLRYVMYIINQ